MVAKDNKFIFRAALNAEKNTMNYITNGMRIKYLC